MAFRVVSAACLASGVEASFSANLELSRRHSRIQPGNRLTLGHAEIVTIRGFARLMVSRAANAPAPCSALLTVVKTKERLKNKTKTEAIPHAARP